MSRQEYFREVLEAAIRDIGQPDESLLDFQERYVKSFPLADFIVKRLAMPCTCEDGGGPVHWAAIHANIDAINRHLSHEKTLADLREMDQCNG